MILSFYIIILSFFITLFLSFLSFYLSEFSILNREEFSTYECGFEHHTSARIPFSIRFFFLTLIFLLFDLEIVLLFFIPFSIFSNFFFLTFLLSISFFLILFLGLIYE